MSDKNVVTVNLEEEIENVEVEEEKKNLLMKGIDVVKNNKRKIIWAVATGVAVIGATIIAVSKAGSDIEDLDSDDGYDSEDYYCSSDDDDISEEDAETSDED